jgi:hypothetical protein
VWLSEDRTGELDVRLSKCHSEIQAVKQMLEGNSGSDLTAVCYRLGELQVIAMCARDKMSALRRREEMKWEVIERDIRLVSHQIDELLAAALSRLTSRPAEPMSKENRAAGGQISG